MPAADRDSLRFSCPQCLARLTGPAAAGGPCARCPQCQFTFHVPAVGQKAAPVDDYPLMPAEQASPTDQSAYVLVICPVCDCAAHAAREEIGRKLVCPDCGTATVVSPPRKAPRRRPPRSAAEIGEYALAKEVNWAAGEVPAAEQPLVAVVCPLCHTRLHARLDQVGGTLVCPDCGTSAVIPPPPPSRRKIDPTAEAGEDYRLAEGGVAAARPAPPPEAAEALPKRPPEPLYRWPVLPRRPLFSGVFGFPFRADALEPTIKLTSGAMIVKLLIAAAMSFGAVGGGGIFALGPAAGSMFGHDRMRFPAGWILAASASGLTVLRDTSYGADAIGQWPSVLALEGLGDSVYLSAALSISAMPGVLGVVAEQLGTPASLDVVLSVWLLFPVILLSMLDNNTPMNPVSLPVWRSVFSAWRAWTPFQTVALAAAGLFWLTEVVTRRAGLLVNAMATGIFSGRGVDGLLPLVGQARLGLRRPRGPRRAGRSNARNRRRPGRQPCRGSGR